MKTVVLPTKRKQPRAKRKFGFVLADFSRDYNLPIKTLTAWISEGCATTSKADAMRWMMANKPEYFKLEGTTDQAQWTKADWQKHRLRFQALTAEHEYERERGEVHSKSDCVQSLVAIYAEQSRVLHGMPAALKTAFPEIPESQLAWLDKRIGEVLGRLKNGSS